MAKARVAVLISGGGTNMAALLYAAKRPDSPYEVVLVASNNPDAEGLKLAQAEGVATFAQSHVGLKRADHDEIMHNHITKAGAAYVVLAGYMRILSENFVKKWDGRMLNIHPSLLPKYTGLHTHQRAIDAGDSIAGCSVHLVTADLDEGPLLGQMEVAVLPNDTADSLAERVKIAEHQLYPRTLADYVSRATDPDYLTSKVREIALTQPEADEVVSHGMPCFGIVAAVAGFLCRPLQPLLLVAMAWGVGWLCTGLAAGDRFAPALILPLLLASLVAACASIAVRREMEHGYRVEANGAAALD